MRVYDFDNTIYDGESTIDFFLFYLKKNISCIKFVWPVIKTLFEYKLCKITAQELERRGEKYMGEFMKMIKDPHKEICEFWDKNQHKIKSFYKNQQCLDDLIISASCEDFLKEICNRLNIKNLIASKLDFKNGKVEYMCYGEKKAELFKKFFPDTEIDEFYTDSKNDLPMIKISKKAFLVKGNKIKKWEEK